MLERYGVVPTYVIDYPVASTASSADRLSEIASSGALSHRGALASVGQSAVHEAVEARMSYGCNLGLELEREKIANLKTAIRDHRRRRCSGLQGRSLRVRSKTAGILEELDFDIDVSVNPNMDFTDDGGPSFEGFSVEPAHFGQTRRLLELPCTTGFIGASRPLGSVAASNRVGGVAQTISRHRTVGAQRNSSTR